MTAYLLIVIVLTLLGSACGGIDTGEATTTDAQATTLARSVSATQTPSTSTSTTTMTAPTTSAAPTTTGTAGMTTTTAGAADTVGDPALLRRQFHEVLSVAEMAYPDEEITLQIPDLTNPDPLVAAEEIDIFSHEVAATLPLPEWAQLMGHPGSPIENTLDENLSQLFFNDWRRVRRGAPYVQHKAEVVPIDDVELDPEAAEDMPASAVAVIDWTSSGPVDLVRAESGELVEVWSEGWSDVATLTILVPTPAGWRSWWVAFDYQGGT